jgi:hypothetical protein
VSSPRREALELRYHRARDRFGLELHKFVKSEEEEADRFRRRMHIHLGSICVSWLVSYLFSLTGVATVLVVTASPAMFQILTEVIDNIGRF